MTTTTRRALRIGRSPIAIAALAASTAVAAGCQPQDSVSADAPIDTPAVSTIAPTSSPTAPTTPPASTITPPKTSDSTTFWGAPPPGAVEWLASAPQTRPTEPVDLGYTWTAYPGNTYEPPAPQIDSNNKYAAAEVAEVEGGRVSFRDALFIRTDDGWQRTELFNDKNTVLQTVGDTVFTDELSEAANHPNGVPGWKLIAFDTNTGEQREVALPDEALLTARDDVAGVEPFVRYGSAPKGDKLVVLVHTDHSLEDGAATNLKEGELVEFDRRPDGSWQTVVHDYDCDPGDGADSSEDGSDNSTSPNTEANGTALDETGTYNRCERPVEPAEIGLTEAQVELANTQARSLWTFDGDTWQRVNVEFDDSYDYWLRDEGVLVEIDALPTEPQGFPPHSYERHFAVGDDGTLSPLFDGKRFIVSPDAVIWLFPISNAVQPMLVSGSYVIDQGPTAADWTATDLSTLGNRSDSGGFEGFGAYATPEGGVLAHGFAIAAESDDTIPTERQSLYVSPDGIRFDTIGTDDLIATVTDPPTDVLALEEFGVSGNQIILNAAFLTPDGDRTNESVIFVGTPS